MEQKGRFTVVTEYNPPEDHPKSISDWLAESSREMRGEESGETQAPDELEIEEDYRDDLSSLPESEVHHDDDDISPPNDDIPPPKNEVRDNDISRPEDEARNDDIPPPRSAVLHDDPPPPTAEVHDDDISPPENPPQD